MSMFNSILIVCVGNICRSPTGERLMKHYCPHIQVSSAGLGALVNYPADENAIKVAAQHDLSLEGTARGKLLQRCAEKTI